MSTFNKYSSAKPELDSFSLVSYSTPNPIAPPALILTRNSREVFLPFLCFHTGAFDLGKYTPASGTTAPCRLLFRGAFTVPVAASTARVGEVESRRVSSAAED